MVVISSEPDVAVIRHMASRQFLSLVIVWLMQDILRSAANLPNRVSHFWQNLTFPAEAYVEPTPISQLGNPGEPHSWILTPRGRQAGLLQLGNSQRLRVKLDALSKGVPTTIVGVGASVTIGHGAADGHAYLNWLKMYTHAYIGKNATIVNAGKPGLTSKYFSACGMQHVPYDADIILIEFAVNDPAEFKPSYDNPHRRAFERLLRRFLNLPRRPAVALLNHFSWEGNSHDLSGVFYMGAHAEFGVFAEYYGLPVMSLRACCWGLMAANITGFHPEPRLSLASPLTNVSFFWDKVHPDGRTGHRVLAELVAHLFMKTLSDLKDHPLDAMDHRLAAAPLPHPMILNNWESKNERCLVGKPFLATVNQTHGFEWVNDRSHRGGAPKWGLAATQPGSNLTFVIDTHPSAQKASTSAGADFTLVEVLHLKSYAKHGKASVTCEVCKCETSIMDSYWSNQNSQLETHALKVSPEKECRITFTVLPESSAPDKGTRVKVAGIVIHEEGGIAETAAHAVHLDLEGEHHHALWPHDIARGNSTNSTAPAA